MLSGSAILDDPHSLKMPYRLVGAAVEASGTVADRNAMPTVDEVIAARVRADITEKMFEMLQTQLAEMTAQRDRWEQRFDQLIPVDLARRRSAALVA
jgi:hypothetical protein